MAALRRASWRQVGQSCAVRTPVSTQRTAAATPKILDFMIASPVRLRFLNYVICSILTETGPAICTGPLFGHGKCKLLGRSRPVTEAHEWPSVASR